MSERPGSDPPRDESRDEDLDYLDAAVSENFDEEPASASTADPEIPSGVPVAPTVREDGVTETVTQEPARGGDRVTVTPGLPRDTSWYWPLINLFGVLVVIGVNYLANAWEFNGQSTGEVVNKDPVPFQPADWTFAIWVLIYALLLVFAVAGLLPAGRRHSRLQRVSPYFLVANVANVLWIVFWHWEQFTVTFVLMLVLLVSVLGIYLGLRFTNPFRRKGATRKPPLFERLTMRIPFSVYLGWILVAALSNLMVWLDRSGWHGGPFSLRVWAVLFMLVGALVAAVFVFTARDGLIPAVMAFGFAGIANHAWSDSALLAVAAVVLVVVCAGLEFLAWVMSYDVNVTSNPFGRSGRGTPPPMTPIE